MRLLVLMLHMPHAGFGECSTSSLRTLRSPPSQTCMALTIHFLLRYSYFVNIHQFVHSYLTPPSILSLNTLSPKYIKPHDLLKNSRLKNVCLQLMLWGCCVTIMKGHSLISHKALLLVILLNYKFSSLLCSLFNWNKFTVLIPYPFVFTTPQALMEILTVLTPQLNLLIT